MPTSCTIAMKRTNLMYRMCSRSITRSLVIFLLILLAIGLVMTGMLETIASRRYLNSDHLPPRKSRIQPVSDEPPPKTVVLTTTNSAFLDLTENWLYSIQSCGVWPNITVIAEDRAAYEALRKMKFNIHVTLADQLSTADNLLFDTPEYKRFVNKRADYILALLHNGYDVLFSDVDTYWVKNPFPYFEEGYDIFTQADQLPPLPQVLCAGFVFYKATGQTLKFVRTWITRMAIKKQKLPDQVVLNQLIMKCMKNKNGVKVKVLDPNLFVSGQFYFNDDWRSKNPHVQPVMLHNNWVIGHDVKVQRFKKIGMWSIK
ncbi:uncharacterized protein [Amphiura filiformis]|uniref:uncharacterized protein n=1 Tax=Amphiura filiformis TaxID=82378 RepID=UPI003B211EC5